MTAYMVIRDLETDEEVHRFEVDAENERALERTERGMALKVDLSRFYFGVEEDPSEPKSNED